MQARQGYYLLSVLRCSFVYVDLYRIVGLFPADEIGWLAVIGCEIVFFLGTV